MFRLNIPPKQYFDLIDGYYNIVQMSKWNKPNKPLSEDFIENEQRRKQIIIEAARRRKEKERKIQQEDERDKRQEEEALKRHKQQKKDAYIKYLHNNLHDKYEQLQRMKKEAKPQIKSNAKWKKKTPQQNSNQLEALDLEVKMDPPAQFDFQSKQDNQISIIQQPNIVKQQRKELIQQFQKQWVLQQSKDELLGSKLLDSLDLDIDTINRGKQVKQIMRQEPKNDQIKELRQLIGYESVLFAQQQAQKQQKPEIKTSKQTKECKPNKQTIKASKNANKNATKTPEVNEVETLNQLKRKKQAKILNWAIQQQQEAEDLFSNCSTKKKSNQALKELNEELKISKQSKVNVNKISNNLPTIAQETMKSNQVVNQPVKTPVQSSNQAPKTPPPPSNQPPSQRSSREKEQNQRQAVISTQPNFKKIEKRTSVQKEESADKKKQVEIKEARQTKKPSKTASSGFTSQKNLIRMRTTSRDKPKNQSKQKKQQKQLPPLKVVQAPKKLGGQLPPLPARTDNNSIATHDLQIDIESFIKQDLLNLNEEQMKIQQQLRQIHKDHKNGIKEVYNKYEIKTDYKHSSQLTGQQPVKAPKYYQNEQDIEQSLQNLDNILIRKELVTRQKQAIKEENQEESQSFINPFSNSQDLCNQVLKLAKNVSRFDVKPEQPSKDGYQYMNKAKKVQSIQKLQQKSRVSKGKEQQQHGLSQSQDVSHVSSALGKPPNILMNNFNTEEKIHVNAKLLKNLLLDDD